MPSPVTSETKFAKPLHGSTLPSHSLPLHQLLNSSSTTPLTILIKLLSSTTNSKMPSHKSSDTWTFSQRRISSANSNSWLSNPKKYPFRYDTAEPDKDVMKHFLYEYYVATFLYHALLNNLASETSSRMNAMENASKNAGEMLDKLTLQFNKAR